MNKKMNKENNNTPFKAEDVDWNELAAIGILKDELDLKSRVSPHWADNRTVISNKECQTAVSCLPHGKRETA